MKNAGINYVTCGENLYAGFDHAFGMTDDWYNSPGHRSNLLHEGFKYVGVGIAEGNDSYSVYSGQNFYT